MTIAEILERTEAKHHNIHHDRCTCDGVRAGNIHQYLADLSRVHHFVPQVHIHQATS